MNISETIHPIDIDEDYAPKKGLFFKLRLVNPLESKQKAIEYIKDGDAVLDIGCRKCQFFDMLKEERKNLTLTGVEIHPEIVEYSRKKGYEVFDDLNEVQGKFDVITLFDVIEHLDEQTLIFFVKRINELLKKNGYLIITTPNIDCYYTLTNFWDNVEHKRPYSLESMKMLFNAYGMKKSDYRIVEVFPVSPIINPIKILRCLLFGSGRHYNIGFILRRAEPM